MDEDKKVRWLLGSLIVLVFVAFLLGNLSGRRGTAEKIKELEDTVDSLNGTVTGLESTVESSKQEIDRLGKLRERDAGTIAELTETSRRFDEITRAQRDLIDAIETGSSELGDTGSGIEKGLVHAVAAVDELIKDIETGED